MNKNKLMIANTSDKEYERKKSHFFVKKDVLLIYISVI